MLIAAATALLVAAGAISLTVVAHVSKGPAFQAAATFLRRKQGGEVVRSQLGVVLDFGLAVTGPISESDSGGSANLSFSVHGNWRTGHVRISETKRGSTWIVTGGVLTVDGQRYQLPCTQTPSITACRLS